MKLEELKMMEELLVAGMTAKQVLEDWLEDELDEKAPKDPYARAVARIKNLEKRGVDVERHTVMRVNKTSSLQKLRGIVKAAGEFGLKKAVRAAKAKIKELQ